MRLLFGIAETEKKFSNLEKIKQRLRKWTKVFMDDEFSYGFFIFYVTVTELCLFGLLYFLLPRLWDMQMEASHSWSTALFVLCVLGVNPAFEFFIHRYILHRKLIPLLGFLCQKHRDHHRRTPASFGREKALGPDRFIIQEESQHISSSFPFYALLGFTLIMMPFYLFLQWLFPHVAVIFTGLLATTTSYCIYEIFHAWYHEPSEKWERRLGRIGLGRFWKNLRLAHECHHQNISTNHGVSAGFGWCMWPDKVFGTFIKPAVFEKAAQIGDHAAVHSFKPIFLIRWLDRLTLLSERFQKYLKQCFRRKVLV